MCLRGAAAHPDMTSFFFFFLTSVQQLLFKSSYRKPEHGDFQVTFHLMLKREVNESRAANDPLGKWDRTIFRPEFGSMTCTDEIM